MSSSVKSEFKKCNLFALFFFLQFFVRVGEYPVSLELAFACIFLARDAAIAVLFLQSFGPTFSGMLKLLTSHRNNRKRKLKYLADSKILAPGDTRMA